MASSQILQAIDRRKKKNKANNAPQKSNRAHADSGTPTRTSNSGH